MRSLILRFANFLIERFGTSLSHAEIAAAGALAPEISIDYQASLDLLDQILRDCIRVSKRYEGISSPTPKHFYASVLFTALIARSVSLAVLAPHSAWSDKLIEHWDYASAATITRSMLEIRAAFHYLCIDKCPDDEWECRWTLLSLHDCISRLRLFAESLNPDAKLKKQLEKQTEELRHRLEFNQHFRQQKHQKKLLNGRVAYLYSLEDILEKAQLEKRTYRFLNILFSSAVHGLPMSYYRMGQQERGRGLPSPVESGYTSICLSLAASLLLSTRDDVTALFAGLRKEE